MDKELLYTRLKRNEGFISHIYLDTRGFRTIGYGLNLENGITEEEAFIILKMRADKAIAECSQTFTWFNNLDNIRQTVIAELSYNLGLHGFQEFKKTIDFISKGLWEDASKELLDSAWANEVGKKQGQRAWVLSEMLKTGLEA